MKMKKIPHRFFYAWIFLTKLPAFPLPKATKEDWGRITPYFVLIGLILGLIVTAFALLINSLNLPVLFSSLLVLLIWVLVTGGFHLDGLMDTFDGIGCKEEERKIEAMKDSRVGAIGLLAGVFVILFKLGSLTTIFINSMFYVLLFSVIISRLVVVYSLCYSTKISKQGASSSLITSGINRPLDFLINLIIFVFISLSFLYFISPGLRVSFLVFTFTAILISLFWSYYLNKHFKGHSGDTYGALIELSEVSALVVAVILKGFI